ncbi:hypothetical protein D3C72_2191560 [compost metagenome]
MATRCPLDVVPADSFIDRATGFLNNILDASTREGVVDALELGQEYLRRSYEFKLLTSFDTVRISRLWAGAAADRLRDLPAPGAPMPVGLFGGQA